MKIFSNIIKNRKLAVYLAKNDMKNKFAGSYLGIVWAFVQPVITILLYWFVFQIGLRSQDVADVPFVLWLMAGLIPWFFFQDAVLNATNSFTEYSYLVKKVVFNYFCSVYSYLFSAGAGGHLYDIWIFSGCGCHSAFVLFLWNDYAFSWNCIFHFSSGGIFQGYFTDSGSFYADRRMDYSHYVEYRRNGFK